VREDDDYWSTIEHYVQEHTTSRFSHGICPQCYTKVMRDFEKAEANYGVPKEYPAPIELSRRGH
jgi:hypothetical protein